MFLVPTIAVVYKVILVMAKVVATVSLAEFERPMNDVCVFAVYMWISLIYLIKITLSAICFFFPYHGFSCLASL